MSSSNTAHSPAQPRTDFYQTDSHVHLSIYARNIDPSTVQWEPGAQALSFAYALTNTASSTSSSSGSDAPAAKVEVKRHLFAPIDPAQSSYTLRPTKAELHLAKQQPGLSWPQLEAIAGQQEACSNAGSGTGIRSAATASVAAAAAQAPTSAPAPTPITAPAPAPTAAQPPTSSSSTSIPSILPPNAPTRKKNKWETFHLDDDDEAQGGAAGSSSAGAGSGSGGGGGDADINDFFKQLYAGASDDARRAMIKSFQESNGTTLSMNWDEVKKGKVETRPPDSMVARKYD